MTFNFTGLDTLLYLKRDNRNNGERGDFLRERESLAESRSGSWGEDIRIGREGCD